MSVLEVIAVAGSVASIVSGFGSAVSLLHKWRDYRRRERKWPFKRKENERSTDQAEHSLAVGGRRTQHEYDIGVSKVGGLFRIGDGKCRQHLQAYPHLLSPS